MLAKTGRRLTRHDGVQNCSTTATCSQIFHGGLPSFHFFHYFQSFGFFTYSPLCKRSRLTYAGSTMVRLPNRPNNLLGLDARFSTLFGCPRPGLAAGESARESAEQCCSTATPTVWPQPRVPISDLFLGVAIALLEMKFGPISPPLVVKQLCDPGYDVLLAGAPSAPESAGE